MLPTPYTVTRIGRETHDTFTMRLEPTEGAHVHAFAAGQFNMMYVFGVGEVPLSISGDPTRPDPLVHTVRAVGAVSAALCRMKAGDVVGIRGPFGTHWPVEESVGSDILLLAGGIGLAPLRPALYHVIARRGQYGRVIVLYGTRTPADILFRKEVEQWRARFDLDVHVTVDRGDSAWRGHVGVVTSLLSRAPFDSSSTVALVCGPEIMMRFCVRELLDRELPEDSIYLSMERNMKCGLGLCGRCQYGPTFICKDGPVFRLDAIHRLLGKREV
jgi:NAD(P)H-flavin reductase